MVRTIKALILLMFLFVGGTTATTSEGIERLSESDMLYRHIVATAGRYGLDPALIFAVIDVESRWRVDATSSEGAEGLMQLLLSTARGIASNPALTRSQLRTDPYLNTNLGIQYLSELIGRHSGDVKMALLSYNRGIGNVLRDVKAGRDPDNGYPALVFKRMPNGF